MAKISPEINLAGIKISKKTHTPLYTQVYDQFREMILNRRLRPGDRLPATRNLAKEMGVSRTIVTQSFEQLILEGYLVGKTGSGTFVSEVLPDHLMNAFKTPSETINGRPSKRLAPSTDFLSRDLLLRNSNKEDIVPFQTGTPSFDYFPYKTWFQVSNKVMKKLKTYHLGYEDTLGYWPLRQEIASYLRVARAVKCEAEQVIVVTGSQQGLNLIVQCLLKKGDSVWMEDPGYHGVKFSFYNLGVNICPIPVQHDGLDVHYAINRYSDARFAYVTPSHQFPLGGTLSLPKRLQLLEWAHQNNMWILEDDYDSEFRYEGRPLASLQGLDTGGRVIYSGTFSKVLFPGLRLAYLVLPNLEMVQEFKKIKAMVDRQSPAMDQIILSRFMEEGHFLRHIRKMRLLYSARQAILVKLVNENLADYIEIEASPAGMNLTAWLSDKIDLKRFKEEVLKHGLVIPFINDYALENFSREGITLGYTAFSKYKLKTGVEKLVTCVQNSLLKNPVR